MNIRLILSYDGTPYYGWQKTATHPSIEDCLEKALKTILQHPVILQAASRTDRGVHAHGQVVNFFTNKEIKDFTKFQFQLNSLLPKTIRVNQAEQTAQDFHPTLDVDEKTYRYLISPGPFQLPTERHFAWHVYYPLDLDLMQQAALLLVGTHDFSGFSNRKIDESYTDHIRTVHAILISKIGEQIQISISGNHFLYKMVRNIVGTLVYIGCKKLPISVINSVLINKNRNLAGITAPAHGLSLYTIKYKEPYDSRIRSTIPFKCP